MQKIFFYNFAVVSNYTSNVFMKAERIGVVTVVINALVKKVLEDWDQHQSEKADGDEKKLVERFVYKYFFKLKMKGNI